MLTLLSENIYLLLGASFVLGTLVGSFLNVVIYRLPVMMEQAWHDEIAIAQNQEPPERSRFNLLLPRSRCGHCGHVITAMENIPILSWLALRRRCSHCAQTISARYPLVELITGLLFVLCAWQFGAHWQTLAAMVFCASLVVLTGIDLDTQLLPDQITLPLLWFGLLVNLHGMFTPLSDAIIGAVLGYLSLWSVYWLFKLLTGREGMGYGDFKLLAALGAWFGWAALPMLLLISSAIGAVIGIGILLVQRKDRHTAIAFGPYLAIAGLLTLFVGTQLRSLLLWA